MNGLPPPTPDPAEGAGLIVLLRYKPGVVGETRRVVHVVPLPIDDSSAMVIALCGARIALADAESVSAMTGMPCTLCLLRAPIAEHADEPESLPPGIEQPEPSAPSASRLQQRRPGTCLHPMLRPADDATVPLWLGWFEAGTSIDSDAPR